ncbi:MAG: hypothetical protein ACR2N2_07295 [Acidimicrobiia bacterium]
MAISIACPSCGEAENLIGTESGGGIELCCGTCGHAWQRSSTPACGKCGSTDLQTVPLAIVERSRGTQLSIHGTRPIDLCSICDADALTNYHANRPNPLMPTDLPTVGEEQMNG